MRSVLLLAALLGLILTAPAGAAFDGSNGKVAYLDDNGGLMIDDPFDDVGPGNPIAYAATTKLSPLSPASAPQWSPDGTQLLFTQAVDNGELPQKHSAVFVSDRTGQHTQQITQPFPGKVPSCGTCQDGESAWDVAPVWQDDDTIAFIRWVAADDNATHVAQEGTSVRRVELAGGSEDLLRHYPNDTNAAALGLIWPSTWSEPVVTYADSSGYSLRGVSSGTVLASAFGITDVDASPDGEKLAYAAPGPGGYRVVTIAKDGRQLDSFDPGIGAPNWVRFTPDNNGVLIPGCADDRNGNRHCGLITHRLPDPEADVKP
ncbi:MAG: hypothetical protein QOI80_1057, partial [Solirubrobacteraceae bacterium]|nr:hypothetical protein [Solirubrobacteraceae bacterium]